MDSNRRNSFRGIQEKSRAVLLLWFALLILPALACNFPLTSNRPSPPAVVSLDDLRATVTALSPSHPMQQGTALPDAGGDSSGSPEPFPGLETATPEDTQPSQDEVPPAAGGGLYITRSGDTLQALAARFGVGVEQIEPSLAVSTLAFLPNGLELSIPDVLAEIPYPAAVLPDSEVIDSPSTAGFDLDEFIRQQGGYLNTYREEVDDKERTGAQIVERVSLELSVNPRLLLALLEFRSGWVRGAPETQDQVDYPLGFRVPGYKGLYSELTFAGTQLNIGFYGWRSGSQTEISFFEGGSARLSPRLNAGSVALQHLFARWYRQDVWEETLYGTRGFLRIYDDMFPKAWERAASVEPLFPSDLSQPALELPFQPGERWSFTAGPHRSWNSGTPAGALDFSPITGEAPCSVSASWVTASAAGLVTRSQDGIVALDLDGDGHEGTGWVLLYFHIADQDRISPGSAVVVDARLGHPSCQGGRATGTHVHMARKYNGEWISAQQALAFTLSGWTAVPGERSYEGFLIEGDSVVAAHPGGASTSVIVR